GEAAVGVLADHVGEGRALGGGEEALEGARRARAAEGEAGLGLDEVARIAALDEGGERGAGRGVAAERAERPRDRPPRLRVRLAPEGLEEGVAGGVGAQLAEGVGAAGPYAPER